MPEPEFHAWREFYRMQPFDDKHRFHRPAAMVAAAWGGKFDERLDFLAPEPVPPGMSAADWQTLKTFGIKPKG